MYPAQHETICHFKRADAPGQLCCGVSLREGPAPTEGPTPLCPLTRAHAREGRFGGGAEEEPWSPRSLPCFPLPRPRNKLPCPAPASPLAGPHQAAARRALAGAAPSVEGLRAPTRRGRTAALRPSHAAPALPPGRLRRAPLGTALASGRESPAPERTRPSSAGRSRGGSVTAGADSGPRVGSRSTPTVTHERPFAPSSGSHGPPRSCPGARAPCLRRVTAHGLPRPDKSRGCGCPPARLPRRGRRARLSSPAPLPSSPRRRRKEVAAGPPRPRMRLCRAGAAPPRSGLGAWVSLPGSSARRAPVSAPADGLGLEQRGGAAAPPAAAATAAAATAAAAAAGAGGGPGCTGGGAGAGAAAAALGGPRVRAAVAGAAALLAAGLRAGPAVEHMGPHPELGPPGLRLQRLGHRPARLLGAHRLRALLLLHVAHGQEG